MNRHSRSHLHLALLVALLTFAVTAAVAQENPIAYALDDASIGWGPCPDFMPEGCSIAVLHGNPAEANADILFRVPAGSNIAAHWHTSAERMILLSGKLEVTYEGKEPVNLKKGMYAYGPAKASHSARCAEGEPCVLFIAFESAVDAIATE
jgi:quercetin dioxygenase-like cupin family protein